MVHYFSSKARISTILLRLRHHSAKVVVTVSTVLLSVSFANAQNAAEVAKKLSNPISSMISVPFQYNFDSSIGPNNGSVSTLNIQPVIPISIGEDWNLISRTILPVKKQSGITGASETQFGLGDTLQSFWFSPKMPTENGLIWGVGPVIYIPTATDSALGANTWGGGLTAVALKQSGPWTYGGLTNHVWSFGNDKINATFVQPFISYTTPSAVTFALNTEATYDWNIHKWSVPVNANVSKVLRLGNQLVSITAGAGYYAASMPNGPDGWRGRLIFTLLLPK